MPWERVIRQELTWYLICFTAYICTYCITIPKHIFAYICHSLESTGAWRYWRSRWLWWEESRRAFEHDCGGIAEMASWSKSGKKRHLLWPSGRTHAGKEGTNWSQSVFSCVSVFGCWSQSVCVCVYLHVSVCVCVGVCVFPAEKLEKQPLSGFSTSPLRGEPLLFNSKSNPARASST